MTIKTHKNYVVGFLFNAEKNRVVLIEKRKPAWQIGRLNGVGGRIGYLPDGSCETPIAAMSREFYEEAGVRTPEVCWETFCILTARPPGKTTVNFLRAFDTKRLMDARTTEAEKIVKIDLMSFPSNVMTGLRWVIPLALDPGISVPVFVCDDDIESRETSL